MLIKLDVTLLFDCLAKKAKQSIVHSNISLHINIVQAIFLKPLSNTSEKKTHTTYMA